jgi:hypothetical protein
LHWRQKQLQFSFRGSDEPASSPEYRGKIDTRGGEMEENNEGVIFLQLVLRCKREEKIGPALTVT